MKTNLVEKYNVVGDRNVFVYCLLPLSYKLYVNVPFSGWPASDVYHVTMFHVCHRKRSWKWLSESWRWRGKPNSRLNPWHVLAVVFLLIYLSIVKWFVTWSLARAEIPRDVSRHYLRNPNSLRVTVRASICSNMFWRAAWASAMDRQTELTLWRLLLPYGNSYKAPCARPG